MPQGPLFVSESKAQGISTKLNIAAAAGATLVKGSPGRVMQLTVNTASTGAITVYDSATVAGAATANIVYQSPAVMALGTIVVLDFPCLSGIVVTAGTGSVVAVSYN
jgi:hypothetical protein